MKLCVRVEQLKFFGGGERTKSNFCVSGVARVYEFVLVMLGAGAAPPGKCVHTRTDSFARIVTLFVLK